MTDRSRTFGAAAADYERFRPGYPEALVDQVLAYAVRPVRTALEIGAGTGKATRVFAARGLAVTATDPDAQMLVELRRHVPSSVVIVEASFEALPLTTTYDVVFAAASLHWTASLGRSARLAALLEPDGVFASFGGQMHLADDAVAEAVENVRSPFLDDDLVPSPDRTTEHHLLQWPGSELAASEHFVDVRQQVIERRSTMSAHDYVSHLSTISAYLALPAPDRTEVLAQILAVLPDTVSLTSDLTLHLARLKPSGG